MSDELNDDKSAGILALPMGPNDADEATIGSYLVRLLEMVWDEQEGFDGKRPFGNSGWDGELLAALIRAGVIEGTLSEDGNWIDTCIQAEWDKGQRIIADAIHSLRPVVAEPVGGDR